MKEKPNPRINADTPRQFSAGLGFEILLSLVENQIEFRVPVMRNVVRHTSQTCKLFVK
jgi:hypothetical protein